MPQVFLQVEDICTLVSTPRLGGQWWSSLDVVMIFAKVRRLSVVRVQVISGAGSIEYFIFVHTSISTLPASFSYAFGGDRSLGSEGHI